VGHDDLTRRPEHELARIVQGLQAGVDLLARCPQLLRQAVRVGSPAGRRERLIDAEPQGLVVHATRLPDRFGERSSLTVEQIACKQWTSPSPTSNFTSRRPPATSPTTRSSRGPTRTLATTTS